MCLFLALLFLNNCAIFKPTKKKSAFIELTSFKSLFLVKFQVSTLEESQHLLVKLSCESACENLDAVSARSALCFFSQYCSWARSHRGCHCDCGWFVCTTHASDLQIHRGGRRRVKNGSRRGDPNLVCWLTVFSTLPLFVCVCLYSVGTWEKSRLLTLKTNLATWCQNSSKQPFFYTLFEAWIERCSPNSDFWRARKSLRTAGLAMLP